MRDSYKINIALDELYSNIVRYSGASEAKVSCVVDEHTVTLHLQDNGVPFDPTAKEDADMEQLAEEEPIPQELVEPPPAPAATQSELYRVLPKEAQELIDDGILRVNGITPIFSRISFFFMMKPFAEKFHLAPPVTELEVEPLLYRMAEILERAREAIERHLAVPEPLPLYLAVPDMLDFIVDYERGERLGSEKLGRELAETLAAGFRCDVNRISIS